MPSLKLKTAESSNSNKGISGTNRQHDQNRGNRGKQLNPNQKGGKNNNSIQVVKVHGLFN
ncbi:hypothetical protein CXF72_07980 [Psychromonas sp. MB-3u-54]|nr:hypothetical protein CXF72_07980 [Psychromonas sp. MB-3u-54]